MSQIRPGRQEDHDAVMNLWNTAGLSGTSEKQWQTLVEGECSSLLVAEEEGAVVGAGVVSFDGWRAIVYHVAVAPKERRHGLGTALMEEAESEVRRKGATRMFALVHESMTDGLALCATRGYEPEGDLVFVKGLG